MGHPLWNEKNEDILRRRRNDLVENDSGHRRQANVSREIMHAVCPAVASLLHEFRRLTFVPWIVGLCEEDPFVDRGVIVEPHFYGGRRRRLVEIDFGPTLEA